MTSFLLHPTRLPAHHLLPLGLLLGGACLAQPAPGPHPHELRNVAQLSSRAMVEVPQDRLQLFMSTTVQASDALTVQTQLKKALEQALATAKKGVQPGQLDVRTGNFGLEPRYDNQGRATGWQGTAELVLEGRDIAGVTAAAAGIKTLTIARVVWDLSPEQKAAAEAQARKQAIADFRNKAAEVAKSFGFSAYDLREVTLSGDGAARPERRAVMATRMGGGGDELPVEAGKEQVSVSVSGSVQMR